MALFGIKRIQYCKATQLAFSGQNNPFWGIASEPTNTFTDVVCLINSRATLTIEQAVVNKQIVYTAKLQFVTPADPMLDVDHYAFIATTNEGERILLGANTRPQVAVVTAQGVFGTSGELTAYTTTAEFKANYRPLRLPVTAAEPISGPAYDICCGQIKTGEPVSGPAYDVCCGQIKTAVPVSGPAYEVCCGEIVGKGPEPEPDWRYINPNIQSRQMELLLDESAIQPGTFYNDYLYSADNILFGLYASTGSFIMRNIKNNSWIYFEIFKNYPGYAIGENCAYNICTEHTLDNAEIDTNQFDIIYKQEAPTIQIGFKKKGVTFIDVRLTKGYSLVREIETTHLGREVQFWIWISFDGHTKIQTKVVSKNTGGGLMSLKPCYFKAIAYDYDNYYIIPNSLVIDVEETHPIYSPYNPTQQIGWYTDEWQGEI